MPKSPAPLYEQIRQLIVAALAAGEWRPGDALPSEAALAERFHASPGTVRRALDELSAEHVVERRQGRGTFVATHTAPRNSYRFLRLVADDGVTGFTRELLHCRRARATAETARALQLRTAEPVIEIRRLLLRRGRAVVLDDLWLPLRHFEGLSGEVIDAYPGTLYALFEERYQVHMVRAEEKLRAVSARAEAAELLGVPDGAPLLSVERVAYTYGDRAVELRRGLYHTQADHYLNELN
ncbi:MULTISPECIES: GntR family transcriptional regulator [unclassified Roseateles]|jgi:GntR family transcriptional regulator|uniref:GntR family transcriptional regulator n=1 Tax=unclassified Roseateles TaxID=2626991 RepID=UPI0006FDCF95|nr:MULTISPECIES: GntR family transcriptional regulator [unclassified Roseateles]KQW41161.1 GntR family transcriptional regulator [Pelomonas sp. Root405]KRA67933.1 GntR family transcriptional regulator [Pelomonas sp. Root662]